MSKPTSEDIAYVPDRTSRPDIRSKPPKALRPRRALVASIIATVCILTPMAVAAPSQATPPAAADPAEIGRWHAIAARTVATEYGTPAATMALYFSLASIAMYDAVV